MHAQLCHIMTSTSWAKLYTRIGHHAGKAYDVYMYHLNV